MLIIFAFCLSACSDNTEVKKEQKVSLAKENLFDYISFNVNYSDYSVSYIEEAYFITCRVELTTAPRIPNIEFESVTIQYNTGAFLAIGFSIPTYTKVVSQLDNKGYSSTSFYCYDQTNYGFYPSTSFPKVDMVIADISSVEGSVIVEVATND